MARLPPSIREGAVVAGRYRIERALGSGGMGVVVVATQLVTEQSVAIKFMHVSERLDPTSVAAKRFAREAKAAAMLTNEHVTRVLDVATLDSGEPYIVMEYLKGADLEQLAEARGPLPVAETVDYILQALEALAEAHLVGIIHRDLKPSNLFVTRTRDVRSLVKVLDFGLSKLTKDRRETSEALTKASSVLGSPASMAPEQIHDSKDIDGRADIWAIGVTLYRLLEGRLPFAAPDLGKMVNRVMAHPPHPFERGDIPDRLRSSILKCLEKKPGDRFQNVYELARALVPFGPSDAAEHLDRIRRLHVQMLDTRPAQETSSGAVATAQTSSSLQPATDFGVSVDSFKSAVLGASTEDADGGQRLPVLHEEVSSTEATRKQPSPPGPSVDGLTPVRQSLPEQAAVREMPRPSLEIAAATGSRSSQIGKGPVWQKRAWALGVVSLAAVGVFVATLSKPSGEASRSTPARADTALGAGASTQLGASSPAVVSASPPIALVPDSPTPTNVPLPPDVRRPTPPMLAAPASIVRKKKPQTPLPRPTQSSAPVPLPSANDESAFGHQ